MKCQLKATDENLRATHAERVPLKKAWRGGDAAKPSSWAETVGDKQPVPEIPTGGLIRFAITLLIVSSFALPSYGSWVSDRLGVNVDANKAAGDAARAAAAAAEQAAREAKKQVETNPAGVAVTVALGPGAAAAVVAATSASNALNNQKDKTIEEGKQAAQTVVNDANSKATALTEKDNN
jgi:hypothetical protein